MFLTIRTWNVHGGFSGKNLDHSIINDIGPKTAIFKGFSTLSGFRRKSKSEMVTFDSVKWKFRLSVKSPRKPHVRENSGWFFRIFFVRRVGCFEWSIHFWVHILGLVTRMDFILHIFIMLNGLNNLAMICVVLDHSKITKNAFLNDPKRRKISYWLLSGVCSAGSTWHCISWQY